MASKQINVGGVLIGGGAPVTVQSMTNTKTENVQETAAQINELAAAGCDIVRLAVPSVEAARAISKIKEAVSIPVVADIHFDYKLAVEAAYAGADKIRINPGNIGGEDNVKAVVKVCREKGLPVRIGVNGGSIERDILEKHGGLTAQALASSALRHVEILNRFDFDDICLSVKASSVPLTVEAYRLLSEQTSCPLHLGVTETGTEYIGTIKSAIGIGALLLDGIGDTIRVSLTAQPVREVAAGIEILRAAGIRNCGVELISCPTCGRTCIDLINIATEVQQRLSDCNRDIVVAVMGCVVNGPGEARRADYGIAGGQNEGVLFKKGEIIKKVPSAKLVDELIELIEG